MPVAEIEEILAKYKTAEEKINKLLSSKANEERRLEKNLSREDKKGLNVSLEEAKTRNRATLQELETVKGNLRSKAIFSPAEMQWEQICKRYKEEPSLPVTRWKCHLPVFV